MTAKLLPCPFCGLEDGCVMGNKTDYVLCLACGAQGPYVPAGRKAVKLAINDWNRRTQPPAEEGEREIIATYKALHANKLGAHWLWVVIEQIAAGVPETQALREFDYYEKRPAGEVAKDAARYRWLRDQADPCEGDPHVTVREKIDRGDWSYTWTIGETLDAAVDAAMSALPVLPTKE